MISRKFPEPRLARAARNGLLAAGLLLLSACATPPNRPAADGVDAQAAREAQLAQQPSWSFTGRVAISGDGQAGNARIDWRQQGDDFDVRLSAPVGARSWRLHRVGTEAVLEGLDGGPRRGPDAENLLLEATGWRIPVSAMAAWLRGRAAGPDAVFEFAADGLPSTLLENGWSVEYRDWSPSPLPMPTRLFARQGTASVRLVVDRWDVP